MVSFYTMELAFYIDHVHPTQDHDFIRTIFSRFTPSNIDTIVSIPSSIGFNSFAIYFNVTCPFLDYIIWQLKTNTFLVLAYSERPNDFWKISRKNIHFVPTILSIQNANKAGYSF